MNKHALLNVLKYPISDQPSASEFAALPPDLFAAWRDAAGWTSTMNHPAALEKFYSRKYSSKFMRTTGAMNGIILLRKMIAEYEEPPV